MPHHRVAHRGRSAGVCRGSALGHLPRQRGYARVVLGVWAAPCHLAGPLGALRSSAAPAGAHFRTPDLVLVWAASDRRHVFRDGYRHSDGVSGDGISAAAALGGAASRDGRCGFAPGDRARAVPRLPAFVRRLVRSGGEPGSAGTSQPSSAWSRCQDGGGLVRVWDCRLASVLLGHRYLDHRYCLAIAGCWLPSRRRGHRRSLNGPVLRQGDGPAEDPGVHPRSRSRIRHHRCRTGLAEHHLGQAASLGGLVSAIPLHDVGAARRAALLGGQRDPTCFSAASASAPAAAARFRRREPVTAIAARGAHRQPYRGASGDRGGPARD
jgi:hypothetical protein